MDYSRLESSSYIFESITSKKLLSPFLQWLQTAVEMACESEHSDILNLLMNEQEKVAKPYYFMS